MIRPQFSPALLLALALSGGPAWMASTPARAATTDASFAAFQSFADQTLRASDAGLDTLARQFQPVQIPFVADALARGTVRDADYEAIVRWHLWLNGRLDPDNTGLWTANSAHRQRGVSAAIASLELVQLRALAEMAQQRGYVFDALVWWKERQTLERRLAQRLYDPLRGAYADVDSAGALRSWRGPESVIPLALGAPAVSSAASRACRVWLWDDDEALPASSRKLRASQALDPLQGWPLRPGLDLWDVETTASLVRSALARGPGRDVATTIEEALNDLGIESATSIPIRLGARAFPVALPSQELAPLARTETALDFLVHVGLITEDETRSLREARAAIDPLAPAPLSVLSEFGASLGRWRSLDLTTQQYQHFDATERTAIQPNGTGPAAAFRFDRSRDDSWTQDALRLLTQDFIDLHLHTAPHARYRAELAPHALPRGTRPRLTLRVQSEQDREEAVGGDWHAAWTNGQIVDTPFPFRPYPAGDHDLAADVSPPPDELGIWWLILEGPLRTPVTAPGVAVVEPFEARVVLEGPDPTGAARVHVRVDSRVAHPLRGRMDGLLPLGWRIEPAPEPSFALGPGQGREWTFDLVPAETMSPGRYPMSWQFYEGESLVSRLQQDVVVPFRWLRMGPFSAAGPDLLETVHEPDTIVDLGARLDGPRGTVAWQHLPAASHRGGGWVELTTDASSQPSIWYAVSAFSSDSDLVHVELESPQPALVKLNGDTVARCDRYRGRDAGEATLRRGTNYVLVKCAGSEARAPRFRLTISDVTGEPMHAVNNELEHLMDGIAYVRGPVSSPMDDPRPPRLVPILYRNPTARQVAVVGTFNSWSPTASPMQKVGDGLWKAEVRLAPGQFEYKLAIDGVRWLADPSNPRSISDGFGGLSSILVVE